MKETKEILDRTFILNSIKILGNKYGVHESFSDVVIVCAYSLANQSEKIDRREKEFMRVVNKYTKEEQQLFPKILAALVLEYDKYYKADEPLDILGDIYLELNLYNKSTAQFFTPMNVCKLMSNLVIDKEIIKKSLKQKGYITIADPACGSGRTLYASYSKLLEDGVNKEDILVEAADIDLVCSCMTYIQLSIMGASAIVYHQNSLSKETYDTFYTLNYVLNTNLQEKMVKNTSKGDDFEV